MASTSIIGGHERDTGAAGGEDGDAPLLVEPQQAFQGVGDDEMPCIVEVETERAA